MNERIETSRAAVYDIANLTPERRDALTRKCGDAYARATLRKLRAAILFALSEPEGLPVYDEDTGMIGPQKDYDVMQPIRNLLARAMHDRTTWAILTQLGWNERMCCADWETMLQHLPAEQFRPLPWPGQ